MSSISLHGLEAVSNRIKTNCKVQQSHGDRKVFLSELSNVVLQLHAEDWKGSLQPFGKGDVTCPRPGPSYPF
jgi:hypothetical protein